MLKEWFLLWVVWFGVAGCQGLDLTTQEGTNGSSVVTACLSRLRDSAIFTADNEMMRRIAYVETDDGDDPDTYRANYNGGIWAVDEDLFDETQNTASYSSLSTLHQSIETEFSIDWSSVVWNDLRKPLYSALAARLYLTTVSASIPISSSIDSQATYWVTNYNPSGSTSTFVTRVNELLALDECSVSGIDIYFVMDESGSVGSSNYQLMKQFVYDTVNGFDIGVEDTQVGVISYSSSATARFYLNTYQDKSSLLTAIDNLPYNGGGTNTAAAIDLLRQSGFTSTNGGRPESQAIPRVGVIITDGYSNSYSTTVSAAQNAHDDDITLFAVGVGGNVNNNELDAIASDPSYVSTITGFDSSQFEALQTTITNEACTTSAEIEVNETVDTSVGYDETTYIEIPYDSDKGVTIKVNVTNGTVVVYASDRVTTPNEAFYDWMIETDGYSDVYLDPDAINRTVGDTVYIAIDGEDADNDFTFVSEEGDTTEAPDAPVNVTIGTVTAKTVSISWVAPTSYNPDRIIRYDIEVIEKELGLSPVKVNTVKTTILVTGLEEHNKYSCKVAAVSNSQVGEFSSLVNFTTLEAAPSAAPQSPTGSALSSDTITLEWDPPPTVDINGEIEYYVVEVDEVYTGRMWTFHAVDDHINIASLHAYYVYRCRIATFTIALGPYTSYYDVYSGEKAPTAAPENVSVVDDSPSSVDLTWDSPPYEMQNGRIRHYNVEIKEVETENVLEFMTNSTNITVGHLVPFYNYTCTVSAETVAEGPSSDEITFVLPEGAPDGSPENISGSAASSTSINVTWDPPARNLQNGYIVRYRVTVTETDTSTESKFNVTSASLTVTSLHPYYVYTISVAAETVVGIGPYSDGVNVTTDEDVPTAAPRYFSAVVNSAFEADLSWSPPPSGKQNGIITNYVINITEDDSGDQFTESTSNTSLTIDNNLRPYYTYTCVIAAETSAGQGPFSSEISFTTDEYVPSEPSSAVLRRDGEPNELLVTWTAPESPNGVILNYTVYCNDSESVVTVSVSGTELSAVVMNLTPFTYYDCYVTANTSVGEGDQSQIRSNQTDESEPGDAPTNFISTVINSTAIKLTWDEPLLPYGVLVSYTITYNTSDGNISIVKSSTETREVVVGDLEEHTRYMFAIVASTQIGSGPSASVVTRTDISEPHSPPSSITFEVDSSTEITLSWQPPPFEDRNGPITYYSLILTELVFGLDESYVNVTALSYTFTGLEEYNNYSFIIAAATEKGLGPYSSEHDFTTEEDNPSSPPSNVSGDIRSATLVVFTWVVPPAIDQNGVITYYVIKLKEIETAIVWTFFAVDEDINIGSLHPFYHYDCTAAASTSVGTGPRSTAVRVQMEEAAPSGPPLSLTSQKTSRSLTLSWDPPANESQNGIIRQYRIRILEDDTSTTTMYTSSVSIITITDLHPYYTYKCSVAAESVDIGPYTAVLTVQLDEDSPATAPIDFTGTALSSTSISLSWNPPALEDRNGIIRSYTINSTELESDTTFSYTSVGTTLRINSLHPYYQYQFTISAVTVSSGPSSSAITVRTLEDAPSSPAQNSTVEGTTSTTISLSWEPPAADQRNGIIMVYVIRVVSVDEGTTLYYNSSVPSATVTSLKPYTTYECSIAAETSAGRGPFNSAITIQTDEAAPSSSPQNLTGTSMNSDTITLSWSPPPSSDTNGVIREYRINVTEVETGRIFFLTSTTTSITVRSLHPYYTYRCTISAYTVGVGPYATTFSIRTPEDVPSGFPQSFSATSTSSRSAILTWDPPNSEDRNGIVVEYTINVSAVETGEQFQLISTTTSLSVTSLRPFTTYRCIIAASTSVGVGPFSTAFTLVTPEDVPTSAPLYPSGYPLSSSSIYLSWDPPPQLERHGIIREYKINLTELETGVLTVYSTSSKSIELSLLHPFYTYTWIVTAVTTGEGPYTSTKNVTTYEDVPSGSPLNISAVEVFSRSFTLTWDPPAPSERNGIITGYNITVTSLDSMFEDPQEFFTPSQSLIIDSLDPHTDYVCVIAANTLEGTGPFSLELTVRTAQDVPGAPPSNTTGSTLNATHVSLTWDPPPPDEINGIIQGYRINITELNTGVMSQYIVNDTEAVIGPLHPHYNYNFSIVAFTLVGHGPTTHVVLRTAEAAPSSAPESLQASADDPTSISLSWSAPPLEGQNGIIRHYEVTLVVLETGEIHIRTSVSLTLTITSLRPFTTYNCTVAAETVAIGPSTTGVIVRTLQTAPSAPPENVQASAEDSRTLRLSWEPPTDGSRNGIILRYFYNITELESQSSFVYSTTGESVVVDDLHPYYRYSCIVAAETVELGPYSAPVTIQLPEDAPSSSPTALSVSSVTSTSFFLSWTDPLPVYQNGLIRQYFINITELDTGNLYSYSAVTTEDNVEFLHPYYYYTCSVAAVTVAPGPFSDTVTVQTGIDVPSGPPQGLGTLALSSSSLLLTWSEPLPEQQNGPIVGYIVRIVRVGSSDTTVLNTTSERLQVDSLVPYSFYEWKVAAQTSSGTGPFSSPVIEQTLPDAPDDAPQEVAAINIESRLIELSWSPPPADSHNGEIVHYVIAYTEVQTGTNNTVVSFDTEITLGNLHPFYDYIITISAYTIDLGPSSSPLIIQTLEDIPSAPPTNIEGTAQSATSLTVTWEPPSPTQTNGIIIGYEIMLSVLETGVSQQLTSTIPELMLSDLHPFYTYSFLIAAVTIGPGPVGDTFIIQMPQSAPASPPQNISTSIISSQSIAVTWIPPLPEDQNGIIISFTILVHNVLSGETTFYQRESHHSQLVVESLHPYYEYNVSMAAETIAIGPFSLPQRVQTLEDIPSAPPQNLTVIPVHSRLLVFSWVPPPADTQNGVISSYRVSVYVTETRQSFFLFLEGTELELNSAHPFYTYTFSVAAETAIGTGPFGVDVRLTAPEDVPTGAPQSLEAVAVSSSSIRITWSPPAAEDQNGIIRMYHINVTELPTGTVIEMVAHGDESIEIVNHLHPYYLYECAVAAFTVGLGPPALTQALTNPTVPTDVPQNVVAVSVNATYVYLTWDSPPPEHQNGLIELYHITITEADTNTQTVITSADETALIGQLHPYYTYKFSIAAETVEVGPFTSQISLRMLQTAPSGIVRNVSVVIESASSVTVSWLPPEVQLWNGVVTEYTVLYENHGPLQGISGEGSGGLSPLMQQTVSIPSPGQQLTNSPDPSLVSLPLKLESVLIEGLEEYHSYSFAVYQENAEGISPLSEATMQETPEAAPDGSPQNVMIQVQSSTSVIIKWEPPELTAQNGVIIKYNLIVTFAGNSTAQMFSVPPNVLSVPIEGLQKYSTVSVQIAAETSAGVGPFSKTQSVLTEQPPPSEPKQGLIEVLNETAVVVSWSTPDSPNGVIQEFQVIYTGYKPVLEEEQASTGGVILDGPKFINVPAKLDQKNPAYSLVINDLVPGLTYEVKVRARTDAGYGENTTLTSKQPIPVTGRVSQSSEVSGNQLAAIIIAIIGGIVGIGWIIAIAVIVYYVKRRCDKRRTYKPHESTVVSNSQTEQLGERPPVVELRSIPHRAPHRDDMQEYDSDIDEKLPLDLDESESESTTKI